MRRRACDEYLERSDSPQSVAREDPSILSAVAPTLITGLDAGIIPLGAFPLHNWYYANPLWYYHAPALDHCLRTDCRFYELVDPALRELCKLLVDAGLCTTPSCQGHFYPRARFEQIWDELVGEAGAIWDGGLMVRDSESNEAFRFADDSYRVPWRDFETFYYEINRHQNEGYLGIAFPPDRAGLASRLEAELLCDVPARIERDVELTRLLGRPLVGIYVNPRTPDERDGAWREVTRCIQEVLQQEARL